MKITFTPTTQYAQDAVSPPSPAKSALPAWYRNMPLFMSGNKPALSVTSHDATNRTLRGCIPMLDAMTHGYVWRLPMDIQVEQSEAEVRFRWRVDREFVQPHHPDQSPGLPIPFDGVEGSVAKWRGDFTIKTPRGWSTMFTHPLNRHDLPFRTFSGIVDTDRYPIPVHFPFQLLAIPDNPYIIEAGTPLVQFFPVKRENWVSEKGKFSQSDIARSEHHFLRKIVASYKSQYWTKKSFR